LLSSEQRSCHVCSPEDAVVHQVTKARVQLAVFENEVAQFLETSAKISAMLWLQPSE
jgi:uncharacterized Zn finger protein